MKRMQIAFSFCVGALIMMAIYRWHAISKSISKIHEHPDTYAILATGFAAAVVAIWGIISQRAITRRQVTLEHISRQEGDKELIEARSKFILLAKAPGGLEPFADVSKETASELVFIKLVLNEYELIAIGIERGIIDFELYRLWFRMGVVFFLELLSAVRL